MSCHCRPRWPRARSIPPHLLREHDNQILSSSRVCRGGRSLPHERRGGERRCRCLGCGCIPNKYTCVCCLLLSDANRGGGEEEKEAGKKKRTTSRIYLLTSCTLGVWFVSPMFPSTTHMQLQFFKLSVDSTDVVFSLFLSIL